MVRSTLSLDDVDFTILIATSVLSDLIEKCPPAEACRDAFVRMSKATISMVDRTTGFGNTSTLGSQPLNSPDGYFSNNDSAGMPQTAVEPDQRRPPKRKMTMPKFDMNLKDLFSDDEIASRPLTHQPKLQDFGGGLKIKPTSFGQHQTSHLQPPTYPFDQPSYGSSGTQSSAALSYPLSNQSTYNPLAETISQEHPDFTFDDMSFLDTFPVADPNPGSWGGWSDGTADLDLSFGTGGTGGYDANGNYLDPNGIDLFNGFFFGGDGANNF